MRENRSRWTLDDYITDLFRNNQTDTPEFKIMRGIFGSDRIDKIWEKYVTSLSNLPTQNPSKIQEPPQTTQDTRNSQTTQFNHSRAGSYASKSLPQERDDDESERW